MQHRGERRGVELGDDLERSRGLSGRYSNRDRAERASGEPAVRLVKPRSVRADQANYPDRPCVNAPGLPRRGRS